MIPTVRKKRIKYFHFIGRFFEALAMNQPPHIAHEVGKSVIADKLTHYVNLKSYLRRLYLSGAIGPRAILFETVAARQIGWLFALGALKSYEH
jgi:hypothetical protein